MILLAQYILEHGDSFDGSAEQTVPQSPSPPGLLYDKQTHGQLTTEIVDQEIENLKTYFSQYKIVLYRILIFCQGVKLLKMWKFNSGYDTIMFRDMNKAYAMEDIEFKRYDEFAEELKRLGGSRERLLEVVHCAGAHLYNIWRIFSNGLAAFTCKAAAEEDARLCERLADYYAEAATVLAAGLANCALIDRSKQGTANIELYSNFCNRLYFFKHKQIDIVSIRTYIKNQMYNTLNSVHYSLVHREVLTMQWLFLLPISGLTFDQEYGSPNYFWRPFFWTDVRLALNDLSGVSAEVDFGKSLFLRPAGAEAPRAKALQAASASNLVADDRLADWDYAERLHANHGLLTNQLTHKILSFYKYVLGKEIKQGVLITYTDILGKDFQEHAARVSVKIWRPVRFLLFIAHFECMQLLFHPLAALPSAKYVDVVKKCLGKKVDTIKDFIGLDYLLQEQKSFITDFFRKTCAILKKDFKNYPFMTQYPQKALYSHDLMQEKLEEQLIETLGYNSHDYTLKVVEIVHNKLVKSISYYESICIIFTLIKQDLYSKKRYDKSFSNVYQMFSYYNNIYNKFRELEKL